MAGRGQHAAYGFTIEPPGTHLAPQFLGRLLRRPRGTVRARFGHGMIDIGGGEYAGGGRQHGGWQTPVIARAIQPLVVEGRERSQLRQH